MEVAASFQIYPVRLWRTRKNKSAFHIPGTEVIKNHNPFFHQNASKVATHYPDLVTQKDINTLFETFTKKPTNAAAKEILKLTTLGLWFDRVVSHKSF